jgi:hypothetical protein
VGLISPLREEVAVPYHCQQCPAQGQCAGCKQRNLAAGNASRQRRTEGESAAERAQRRARAVVGRATAGTAADEWLLPEDGEFDAEAVIIASNGRRRVRLTGRERVAAATAIFLHRGSARDVCEWLSLPRRVEE